MLLLYHLLLSAGPHSWLKPALQCLVGALVTGSPKAQWNACYAVSNLLRNPLTTAELEATEQLPELLQTLCSIACSSSNLKVSQAALLLVCVLR